MNKQQILVGLFAAVAASACASSNFVASWKSPTAKPLNAKGATVAAVVMMKDSPEQRSAEDKLASEITARGSKGVPMYKIMPDAHGTEEPQAREALKAAGVAGVVVMQPKSADGATVDFSVPPYSTYWDAGYYAHGVGSTWIDPQGVPYDLVVTVDTMIYSLVQNQLVWAGKSRKTNPASLNELVSDLAKDTADELGKLALLAPQ
jgi:hypothetical protein